MNIEKQLNTISWEVPESTYREDKAYSYSTLAKFYRGGFSELSKLFDKVSSPFLTFGSAVDTLLTDGEEAFKERFFIADFPEVSDTVFNIVSVIYNENKDKYDSLSSIPTNDLINYTEILKYQLRWKPETRVKDIIEKGSQVYNLLSLSEGKELLSNTISNEVKECVDILKNNPATSFYFAQDNPFEPIKRYYQLKFKGEYNNIPLRCMADLIVVDYENKTITPCDLKTSSHFEYDFPKSFIQWSYFIQAQLYWYIIRQNLLKDDYFKDFTLENYRFIVINNKTRVPLVWECPFTKTEVTFKCGDYTIKNWREIVTDLHYYLNQSPTVPKGIFTTKPNNIEEWLKNEENKK